MALEMRNGDTAFISASSVRLITGKEGTYCGKEEESEEMGGEAPALETI